MKSIAQVVLAQFETDEDAGRIIDILDSVRNKILNWTHIGGDVVLVHFDDLSFLEINYRLTPGRITLRTGHRLRINRDIN